MRGKLVRLTATVIAATAATLWACSGTVADSLLWPKDRALWSAPERDFGQAVQQVTAPPAKLLGAPAGPPVEPTQQETAAQQTACMALADLRAALEAEKRSVAECVRVVGQTEEFLTQLETARARLRAWQKNPVNRKGPTPAVQGGDLPAGLPAEFRLYWLGAVAWYGGDRRLARQEWQALLALPAAERHWRSTWAAYMLGQADLQDDFVAARKAFQQVRQLAQAGFADSLGLSAASVGWEACAATRQEDYVAAVNLYLQVRGGDGSMDTESLQLVAGRILTAPPENQALCAADPATQAVVTAYLTARLPYYTTQQAEAERQAAGWLAQLEKLPPAARKQMPNGAQVALSLYQQGQFEAAARWLALAPEADPWALWLRAKLALRAGDIPSAVPLLARARTAFPADRDAVWPIEGEGEGHADWVDPTHPADRVSAELACLQLARREYTEALDLFLRAGYWVDAAEVAENVLTVAELKTYVDRQWPARKEPSAVGAAGAVAGATGVAAAAEAGPTYPYRNTDQAPSYRMVLRNLLARRLMRQKQYELALTYFSGDDAAPRVPMYIDALKRGYDPKTSRADRAGALWTAAKIAREDGMEMLGCEATPDWGMTGGNLDFGSVREELAAAAQDPDRQLLRITPELKQRMLASLPTPEKRYHYRYIAADLAWEAAALMPGNDNGTAEVLYTAGRWLAAQDPQAADRFYKALVRRCGKTALGQAADTKRWFPGPETAAKLLQPTP